MTRLPNITRIIPDSQRNLGIARGDFLGERNFTLRIRSETLISPFIKIPLLINYQVLEYLPYDESSFSISFLLEGATEAFIHKVYPLILFKPPGNAEFPFSPYSGGRGFFTSYTWEQISTSTFKFHLHLSSLEPDSEVLVDVSLYVYDISTRGQY